MDLRKLHSHLQGHPDCNKTPGIDVNTGSLGQGVSVAGGLAMAAKYLHKDYRVYAILGDGEIQEGQVWEAAESAVKYGLDNFVVLLDHNGCRSTAPTISHAGGRSLRQVCRLRV